MVEEIMNNELIQKLEHIEEKYKNKYLRDEVKELYNDVVQNKCKDFKENIFYKQVVEIDEELNLFGAVDENKKRKRLKIYSDSEDDEENENNKKVKK